MDFTLVLLELWGIFFDMKFTSVLDCRGSDGVCIANQSAYLHARSAAERAAPIAEHQWPTSLHHKGLGIQFLSAHLNIKVRIVVLARTWVYLASPTLCIASF